MPETLCESCLMQVLGVYLGHTWFPSVKSVNLSPVWSLPGAHCGHVRLSSGPWQSCCVMSGCVVHVGALSGHVNTWVPVRCSGEVRVLGQIWCPKSLYRCFVKCWAMPVCSEQAGPRRSHAKACWGMLCHVGVCLSI